MVATTHRRITDYRSSAAETCRVNRLSRGAVLRGDEGFGADTIRIDYIGTDVVIAVVIESARASQQLGVERSWTISEHRNWEVISSGATEEPSEEALTDARNRAESWLLWAESSTNSSLRGDAAAFRELLAQPTRAQLREVARHHVTHTTIWGGTGRYGWKCSCGVHDWGTQVENPGRYEQFSSRETAANTAAGHVADAILAALNRGDRG